MESRAGRWAGAQLERPLMYKKVSGLFLKGRELLNRF